MTSSAPRGGQDRFGANGLDPAGFGGIEFSATGPGPGGSGPGGGSGSGGSWSSSAPSVVPPSVVAPSREDPVVRAASEVIGGPAGRRLATSHGFLRALPVIVLLAVVTMGFGVVTKAHCVRVGWTTPDMFWHACYSDVGVLYGSAHLGGPNRPGLIQAVAGTKAEDLHQPPLTAAAMWAVSALTQDSDPKHAKASQRRFFSYSAVLLGGCLVVSAACVAVTAGRRRWDGAHVALAPVVVVSGLLSYDLLAVALASGSLLAWSRRRPALAGLLLGLAAATRPMAAVVAVGVLVVALRVGSWGAAARFAGVAVIGWLGLRLALFPGLGAGIGPAWNAWKDGPAGYGSPWLVPQLVSENKPASMTYWYTGGGLTSSTVTTAALLATIVVIGATATLSFALPHRPRLAHVALLATAGCMLVAKALPPQAALLLVPLVALSSLRWRDHLIWAGTELLYFLGVWLYIAASSDPNKGLPGGAYLAILLIRLAGIGWLAVQALRAMIKPESDPVRSPPDGADGDDDPLLGIVRPAYAHA